MTSVHLLHFEKPYRHARHYLGFCCEDDPTSRINEHLRGRGSPLVRAAVSAGIAVVTAHVWRGADEAFERRVKNCGSFVRWCPLCGVRAWGPPVYDPSKPHTERMKRFGRGGVNRWGRGT